jgi:hypothetical protein
MGKGIIGKYPQDHRTLSTGNIPRDPGTTFSLAYRCDSREVRKFGVLHRRCGGGTVKQEVVEQTAQGRI